MNAVLKLDVTNENVGTVQKTNITIYAFEEIWWSAEIFEEEEQILKVAVQIVEVEVSSSKHGHVN